MAVARWTQINNGALAGNSAGVQVIVPSPTPGNFEAYAVTSNGVYHIADTRPSSGATWTNITGNLFQVTHQIFGKAGLTDRLLANVKAMAVDWRYVIPNDLDNPPTDNPTDPDRTHPVLYVAGEGGVLVSYDDGGSWQRFPSALPAGPNNTAEPARRRRRLPHRRRHATSTCPWAMSSGPPAGPTWPAPTIPPVPVLPTPTCSWPRPTAAARTPSAWRR